MKKRTYDKAFQRSAAEMVIVGGKTMADVARDLGINKSTLKNWKNRTLEGMGEVKINGQVRSAAELEGENRQLRKELECVKRQREILKKALAFFSKNGK
jgi:transposase